VRIAVSGRGVVAAARIERTSGQLELDEAAVFAAERCRFTAGTADGAATELTVLMDYEWSLYAEPERIEASEGDAAALAAREEYLRDNYRPMRGLNCEQTRPEFPKSALRDPGFNGASVVVGVKLVAATGLPADAIVLRSSGFADIDSAALDAINKIKCSFDAAQSTDVRAFQEFVFRIEE